MQIYKPNNQLLISEVGDKSYRYRVLMGQHNVTIYVSSVEQVNFQVGCYLDFQGIRYTIRKKSAIKKNAIRNLEYTVIFESPQADTEKRTIRFHADNRLKFPYTATPREHAELIIWNLNKISSGWQLGECITAERAVINYNHTKCWDGIKAISDTFKTEFELANKTLHIRKVEYNKQNPLSLSYGRGNGFKTGITRDNVDSSVPIEILAVQGGSRNIDLSKYGSNELLLPKNQTISFDGAFFEDQEGFDSTLAKQYKVDAEGLTIQRADKALASYEDSSTDLSNIYPSRVGEITRVEVTASGNYNIYDTTIPESLDYSQYRIVGEEMTVIFQSGNLTAKEFKVMQDKDRITGYVHSERKIMIVSQEYDGQTMPNQTWTPKVGDKYAVYGIMLPDEYVREDATKTGASWDMFREAVKVLYEEEQDKFSFTGTLDGIWSKSNWLNIGGKILLGGYTRFTDDQIIESGEESVLIRMTTIKEFINDPYKPEITLANVTAATYNEDFRKIKENEVVTDTENKNTVNYVKRSWRGMMELVDNIYDPSGSFQEDIVSAVALRSMMLALGDPLLQYTFMNSTWQSEIEPVFVYDKSDGKIKCNAAYVKHMTLGIDSVQPNRSETEYLRWTLPAYSSAVLTYNPVQFYYLYMRVSKSYTTNPNGLKVGTGSFFISPTKVEFNSEANNYILLVAFINAEENRDRVVSNLFGFAELTPGMLRINNIVSNDGLSFLRLLANQMKIGDLDWNVTKQNALTLLNADITIKDKTTGDIIANIDGNTGAAMFGKGAHKFNADGTLDFANGNLLYDLINGLLITGKFESNKDGVRLILDPVARALIMKDASGNDIATLNIETSSSFGSRSSLRLINTNAGKEASFSIYPEGLTAYDPNSQRNVGMYSHTGAWAEPYLFVGSEGDGSPVNEVNNARFAAYLSGETLLLFANNLPISIMGLSKGQIWNDNGILKIYSP